MTYCVAMSLDAGMIFASDSRTNAGVDQVGKFSKMRIFARNGDRVIVTLSSGNLSITQNALNILDQRARAGDAQLNLWNAMSMFDVARLLGAGDHDARAGRRRSGERVEQRLGDAGRGVTDEVVAWFAARKWLGQIGFYVLFALVVTQSVQLVGVYLVFSSLIIPALGTRAHLPVSPQYIEDRLQHAFWRHVSG